MDVMRAFVGVDRLKVHRVADDLVFLGDAVAAVHVARLSRDVQSLADIVAFDDADHVGAEAVFVDQASDAKRGLQAQRNVGHHVSQLLLIELRARQWTAELLAVEAVLARGVKAEFRSPHRAPADAVARAVQTTERAF